MRELRKSERLLAKDTRSLANLLTDWDMPAGREQVVHDMALASLEQVKASTDYDNARALPTIVAFLTALAGSAFAIFGAMKPTFFGLTVSGADRLPAPGFHERLSTQPADDSPVTSSV